MVNTPSAIDLRPIVTPLGPMGVYADDATEVNSALILHWNGRHWAQA
jgi:hypothetical protein